MSSKNRGCRVLISRYSELLYTPVWMESLFVWAKMTLEISVASSNFKSCKILLCFRPVSYCERDAQLRNPGLSKMLVLVETAVRAQVCPLYAGKKLYDSKGKYTCNHWDVLMDTVYPRDIVI